MKKVLLHGYAAVNLGDDLFFRVIADRYPDVQFTLPILNTSYREMLGDVPNLKVNDFFRVAKLTQHKIYMLPRLYSKFNMRKFDAVVCIGGSIFMDNKETTEAFRKTIEKYSFLCDWEFAQKKSVPYFVLGANWGPCYHDFFHDFFSRVFDSLSDLYFRDRYSYNLFADKPAARCGCDILLGSDYISKFSEGVAKEKRVLISVISPEWKCPEADADTYYQTVAGYCRDLSARGYEVILASFCTGEEDELAAERIFALLPPGVNARRAYYRGNSAEMLRLMASCELVIASRFHATILAWTLGTPVFSVIYSDKTKNVIDDLGLTSCYVPLSEIGDVSLDRISRDAALPDLSLCNGPESAFSNLDKILK